MINYYWIIETNNRMINTQQTDRQKDWMTDRTIDRTRQTDRFRKHSHWYTSTVWASKVKTSGSQHNEKPENRRALQWDWGQLMRKKKRNNERPTQEQKNSKLDPTTHKLIYETCAGLCKQALNHTHNGKTPSPIIAHLCHLTYHSLFAIKELMTITSEAL